MSDVTLEHPGGRLPFTVKPATDGPSGMEVSNLLSSLEIPGKWYVPVLRRQTSIAH